MEAKCLKCEQWYDSHLVFVTTKGIYCKNCVPEDAEPKPFVFSFSWKSINALMDYIDGERDLEILEIIDIMRAAIPRKIVEQLRSLIGNEIRESNPKSVGTGDESS